MADNGNQWATVRFPERELLKRVAQDRGMSMEGALLEAFLAWKDAGDGKPVVWSLPMDKNGDRRGLVVEAKRLVASGHTRKIRLAVQFFRLLAGV